MASGTEGGKLKFAIFYELQPPRPWGPDSKRKLHHDAFGPLELAGGLGYDCAWKIEHHFLEAYSHSRAPEVFFGAIGHGILQLTTNYPEFHASEPAQQECKRQLLARELALEEIDTAPYRDRYGPNSAQYVAPARHTVAE